MEEKNRLEKSQNIIIENREKLTFSGVQDIGAFSEEQVQLSTIKGGILVKGSDLKVHKLDVEDGKVLITGMVQSLAYTEKGSKKEQSLLGKMFR